MRAFRRGLLALTAALLLSGIAFAQSDATSTIYAGGNGGVQTGDKEFIRKAAQDGMAKIYLAYAALQNAHSEQVKALAAQILTDYGNANEDLRNIANQQGVILPTAIDPKDQAVLDSLLQLQGDAFDKAYMKTMLKDRGADVAQYKREAKSGANQAVINWANQNLPAIQSHIKEAEKVAPTVGVETAASKDKAKPDTAAKEQH